MNNNDISRTLIDRAIHIIAQNGLDKTTTKQIGTYTGINEAYIYRCFKSKEDLLSKVFEKLDEELLNKAIEHIDILYTQNTSYETRCRLYFMSIWNFFAFRP